MEVSTVRLLAVDVWKLEGRWNLWEKLGQADDDICVLVKTRLGTAVSAGAMWQIRIDLPEYWKDKIVQAHFFPKSFEPSEYLSLFYVFELKPETLTKIVEDHVAYSKHVDALMDVASVKFEGEQIKCRTTPRFRSVLYVEPSAALWDQYSYAAAEEAAKEIRKLLGESPKSVCLPHLLMGTFFFSGVGLGRPNEEVSLVNVGPLQENGSRNKAFPSAARHLLDYLSSYSILSNLRKRFDSLGFYSHTVEQYVEELRPSKKQKRSVLDAYESNFLKDRLQAIEERHSIALSSKKLNDALNFNYVLSFENLPESTSMHSLSSNLARYDVVEDIRDSYLGLRREIEEAAELTIGRESALSDYLRDLTTAEATRANLELQKSVRRLTWVAILIAILAVLASLLTEQDKNWIRMVVLKFLHLNT